MHVQEVRLDVQLQADRVHDQVQHENCLVVKRVSNHALVHGAFARPVLHHSRVQAKQLHQRLQLADQQLMQSHLHVLYLKQEVVHHDQVKVPRLAQLQDEEQISESDQLRLVGVHRQLLHQQIQVLVTEKSDVQVEVQLDRAPVCDVDVNANLRQTYLEFLPCILLVVFHDLQEVDVVHL